MGLADTFQELVDSLPEDWTDLELDLRLADESRYVEAALYLATVQRAPVLAPRLALAPAAWRTASATPPRRRPSTGRCGCSTKRGSRASWCCARSAAGASRSCRCGAARSRRARSSAACARSSDGAACCALAHRRPAVRLERAGDARGRRARGRAGRRRGRAARARCCAERPRRSLIARPDRRSRAARSCRSSRELREEGFLDGVALLAFYSHVEPRRARAGRSRGLRPRRARARAWPREGAELVSAARGLRRRARAARSARRTQRMLGRRAGTRRVRSRRAPSAALRTARRCGARRPRRRSRGARARPPGRPRACA